MEIALIAFGIGFVFDGSIGTAAVAIVSKDYE